jgi:LETM1-like protein
VSAPSPTPEAAPPRLGAPGWLERLLRDVVSAYRPEAPSFPQAFAEAQGLATGRARARRYLRLTMRESGLRYGTPVGDAPKAPRGGQGPEEVLFQAVLRTWCLMALDLAVLAEAPPGPRPEQVLLLFGALGDRLDDAAEIHLRIERALKAWPLPQKLWRRVEGALESRALSLAADPYFGVVLHNGAIYSDAYLFGRLAIAYFSSHTFPREVVERRVRFAAVQKARLVEVLVGLVCAERPPGYPTRRAVLRQIDDLRLPAPLDDLTLDFARRAFEKPPSVKRLAKGLKSREIKRFILEQTVLASLVDGRRSPREVAWTHGLAAQLGFSDTDVRQLELEVADFYKAHRDVVDVFTLSQGAEVLGEEWVDGMAGLVRKNSRAVLKEIRKTGELSMLLARAARGHLLSRDEKRRMREQLLDVARAVPALAIFAAPGGLLLLVALAKVLPFELLPSSFRDDPSEEDEPTA